MIRTDEQRQELERRVAEITSWYHAIDLGDGIRTPGAFAMVDYLQYYDLPESMAGMRVLDVGASTGYFSFEFDRRGAAEVVAIELPSWGDVDWTPRYRAEYQAKSAEERAEIDRQVMHTGFDICCEALGCDNVRKEKMAIYEIAPERLGEFDLVFCGSMLMHVRDPVLGIQRMRSVCKSDGELVVSASTTLEDSDHPVARFVGEWNQSNWWQMNSKCLRTVLECCDFELLGDGVHFDLFNVTGEFKDPHFVCHARPMRR